MPNLQHILRSSSLPNQLSGARLAAGPVIGLVYALNLPFAGAVILILFLAAAATDALDGMIARQYGTTSPLGRFLDPLADKVLVICSLLVLVADQMIAGFHVLAVVLIVTRDLLVTGVRSSGTAPRGGGRSHIPARRFARSRT